MSLEIEATTRSHNYSRGLVRDLVSRSTDLYISVGQQPQYLSGSNLLSSFPSKQTFKDLYQVRIKSIAIILR